MNKFSQEESDLHEINDSIKNIEKEIVRGSILKTGKG